MEQEKTKRLTIVNKLKLMLTGAVVLAFTQTIVCGAYFLHMEPWQKIWWINRVNLFLSVPSEIFEKYLFTIPDSWIEADLKSKRSSRNYVPNRFLGYLHENIGSEGRAYQDSLALINDLSSTTKEALRYREDESSSRNEQTLISELKASLGFNPIKQTSFTYLSGGEKMRDI